MRGESVRGECEGCEVKMRGENKERRNRGTILPLSFIIILLLSYGHE